MRKREKEKETSKALRELRGLAGEIRDTLDHGVPALRRYVLYGVAQRIDGQVDKLAALYGEGGEDGV